MKYQSIKAGDIIVSTPHAENGVVFHKSVILIISHDKKGTSGVMVNKLISNVDGETVLNAINLPALKRAEVAIKLSVYFGGPVEPEKGMIIHTNDYVGENSNRINSDLLISGDEKIITDIILENAPAKKLMILGYAGWSPGQLMEEIKDNDWIVLPDNNEENYNANLELIFSIENMYKWSSALKISGVSLSNYSSLSGHA